MKTLLALLVLGLAAPVAAMADDATPDASFYKHAAEAGIFEVEAGTLAEDKGNNQAVKDLGALMVKDHTAANDKLKAIASAKNISLPTSSSVGQMASKAKLELLSGDTFDKSYVKGQIKAHQQTIALLKKEKMSGQDPEAKAFATEVLPTVQGHLKKFRAVSAGMTAG
jgi:putative membrane protein